MGAIMLTQSRVALCFVLVITPIIPAAAADALVNGDDGERGVSVISEYRAGDGAVVIGHEVYRLSPEAAGSLAEQIRSRSDRSQRFGAGVIFGRDSLGRPQINAIRVVP